MSPLMAFHIAAGTVGVLSGLAALALRKGSRPHRRIGLVFAASMLAMSASGASIAAFVRPSRLNVIAGLLTFYLVATGWAAVRRRAGRPLDAWDRAGFLFALAVGVAGLAFAATSRSGATAVACSVFGSVALLFAASDVRLLVRGSLSGPQRVARHLWRMGLALWIAVASLFLGQARVFPVAIREAHLLPVPVLVVAAAMIFWLFKVRFTSAYSTPRGKELA
jgi:uncharacterized membrane protein